MAKKKMAHKKLSAEDMQALHKQLCNLQKDINVPSPGFYSRAKDKSWIWNAEEDRALKIVMDAVRDCF